MAAAPDLLAWLLPPVLGALLGYVATALLLRQVLHPSPRPRDRRHADTEGSSKFALEMGELVATELLSEEAIRRQLSSPQFKESVRRGASSITGQLLASPLRNLAAGGTPSSTSIGALITIFAEGFLGGTNAPLLLRELVRQAVARLAHRPLGELFAEGSALRTVVDRTAAGLASDESRTRLRHRVESWVGAALSRDVEVAEYLTPEDAAALEGVADSLYPTIVDFFVRWLRSDATRRDLVIRGRFLVRDVLARLTGIQRIIVSAAQFDRTIDSNMDGIVGDALDAVEDAARDPETRTRLLSAIREELRAIRSRSLSEVAGTRAEAITEAASAITDRLIALLATPSGQRGLLALLTGSEGGTALASMTVGELMSRLLGFAGAEGREEGEGAPAEEQSIAVLSDSISDLLLPRLASGGAIRELVAPIFAGALEAFGEDRLGDLVGLAGGRKERLDEALGGAVIAIVESHLSEILAGIDFRTLVARKIDEIDSPEIAGYFLEGLGPQVRVVPFVGALVGALIGVGAVLARLL